MLPKDQGTRDVELAVRVSTVSVFACVGAKQINRQPCLAEAFGIVILLLDDVLRFAGMLSALQGLFFDMTGSGVNRSIVKTQRGLRL